ncbi:M48 family metallopeptidase [Paracoccus sp. SCSIO 75233]|uniref:M48 family metallopeptidase n=1 Tax=Paracoccus sp. SCSIO 75233 TaxID=3017782 RepID=UPI0022F0BFBF|nr:SprT family zinc-dependent metalloprotease [Paracoccus sp. SCSIO 75233]WBU54626.1 SprT family zinc-dependent metalloprotease [Paracoccus sp. SCSIO 75233]
MNEQIKIGDIAVSVRRNARARRMTLRVPRAGGDVVLTMPPRMSLSEGRNFVASKEDWLRRTVSAMPGPQIVAEGARLPVGGTEVTLSVMPLRQVRLEGDVLYVPQGRAVGATVQAWLKHRAHAALREAVDRHAGHLGRQPRAMTLRDTRSRWGSCTADGRLMFSWRLAMAPYAVLDYVAAHEVAHLAHMDHSPRFWAQVEALMPGYGVHRHWLRENGAGLQAWRFKD